MRTLLFILQKEFLQILRNRTMLPLIFLMPVVQMALLSFAANYEVKNLRLAVVDHDLSTTSRQLAQKFTASGYFQLTAFDFDEKAADDHLGRDGVDLILEIPPHFEKDLFRESRATLAVRANAVNNVKAGLASGYAAGIVRDFNQDFIEKTVDQQLPKSGITVEYANWFNPRLDSKTFMVPGILAVLVSMVIIFLTAINLVREKEIGTAEQLNVTPVRRWQVILGKILPFWLIGLVIMSYGLAVAKLLFGIPMLGSYWLLLAFSMVYMTAVTGIGILVSTTAETQQQAMFTSWFFLVILLLLSGLFTPVDSMPLAAQRFNLASPLYYFVDVMRLVMLKGAGFEDIKGQFVAVGGLAVLFNGLAVWRYRKTS